MVVIVTEYTLFVTSQCDICKPTFWRSSLTQHAYSSTRTLLTRFSTMYHCDEHKLYGVPSSKHRTQR